MPLNFSFSILAAALRGKSTSNNGKFLFACWLSFDLTTFFKKPRKEVSAISESNLLVNSTR